jgi:hypothetical protein
MLDNIHLISLMRRMTKIMFLMTRNRHMMMRVKKRYLYILSIRNKQSVSPQGSPEQRQQPSPAKK